MILETSKTLDVDLRTRMLHYKDQYFNNSNVNKLEFFRNVVTNNLSNTDIALLNARCNLEFLKDYRTPVEYGVEIAFGWIMEDIIFWSIQDQGIAIGRDGNDKSREFLEEGQISATADYVIQYPWGNKHLELVVSWTDYWKRTDKLDLRASKYYSMHEKQTICFGVEAPTQQAFLLDIARESGFIHRQNPSWGNKNCFTLENLHKHFKPVQQAIHQINLI